MKNLLVIFTAFTCMAVSAQSKKEKVAYYLVPQVALLNGDNSISGQVQLAGGIQKKNWLLGIGTAIDYYKVRTVPMFADIRVAFGKKGSVFSYMDLGTNIVWALESDYVGPGQAQGTGFYSDLGIGYAFHGIDKKGIIISMGYSAKKVTTSYRQALHKPFAPYEVEYYQRWDTYTLNRIALKLGVKL